MTITPFTRQTNFTAFSQNFPGQQQPGVTLDGEFNAVKLATDSLDRYLQLIQRDDGALGNGVVTPDSLSTGTLGLISGWNPRGDWAAATAYFLKDVVNFNGASYVALKAHVSSASFAADLAAGDWFAYAQSTNASILLRNGVAGGTATAITVTNIPPLSIIFTGLRQSFVAVSAATGAATAAIDANPVAAILRADGTPVRAGDWMAGQLVNMDYAGTHWQLALDAVAVQVVFRSQTLTAPGSSILATSDIVFINPTPTGIATYLLPNPPPSTPKPIQVKCIKGDESSNPQTISGNGHTVDGKPSKIFEVNYQGAAFSFSGSEWSIL